MKYAPTTTTTEAKTLRALAAQGATLVDAADAMCWDVQRVQYWERRLDIRFQRGRRMTTPTEFKALRALAAQGATLVYAADVMGWDYQRIQYWERRLGLRFVREKKRKVPT